MIVYGWSSFQIHSAPIQQYPFGQDFAPGVEVEIRQKYAHIFWIPFFSIGKMWVLKQNDQMFEMQPQMKEALIQYGVKTKTPWYSFIGLILVGVGLITALIVNALPKKQYQYETEDLSSSKAEIEALLNQVESPTTAPSLYTAFTSAEIGDVLFFSDEESKTIATQIYDIDNDYYLLYVPDPKASGHRMSDIGLVEYFYDSTTAVRKARISKEMIGNTVDVSEGKRMFNGVVIPDFNHLTKLPVTALKVEHPEAENTSNQ